MPEKKQTEPTSRGERRDLQKQQQNQEKTKNQASKETDKVKKQDKEKKSEKRYRRRIFPIWLRIIVVLVISAAALVGGAMIGYGVIGDGTPTNVLKLETWEHIIDIVTKTE
ncbi:DNA-directed RNA polymerase subunit beta [Pontibacillus sp. ALD_SL1]|uniref:DNA-directed RNA polymerase subunit beta n=1 Tax=Pontibacillus sp. ALD_SL1 TaxID=2777185 RepID=UPI001A9675DB|nr:DNA-directed RNA polymerase subunit beta [Pontibacillus sp. ALD_SL1]QSS99818.1 DNA-directed RNA polymerase subunit beta [Pontibacillus sp. ALD_SL1]